VYPGGNQQHVMIRKTSSRANTLMLTQRIIAKAKMIDNVFFIFSSPLFFNIDIYNCLDIILLQTQALIK